MKVKFHPAANYSPCPATLDHFPDAAAGVVAAILPEGGGGGGGMPVISVGGGGAVPPHLCGGCGGRIADRFYLLAVDRQWHARCLTCCECKGQLDSELTCFAREGNIYCKDDYYRWVQIYATFANEGSRGKDDLKSFL